MVARVQSSDRSQMCPNPNSQRIMHRRRMSTVASGSEGKPGRTNPDRLDPCGNSCRSAGLSKKEPMKAAGRRAKKIDGRLLFGGGKVKACWF